MQNLTANFWNFFICNERRKYLDNFYKRIIFSLGLFHTCGVLGEFTPIVDHEKKNIVSHTEHCALRIITLDNCTSRKCITTLKFVLLWKIVKICSRKVGANVFGNDQWITRKMLFNWSAFSKLERGLKSYTILGSFLLTS